MNRPEFVIRNLHRTYGGALPTSLVQQVRGKLLRRGFVLLPSDTCYSLGTLALDKAARENINIILGRKDEPISLAFGSYLQAQRFVEVSDIAALLFEHFTPGPITIVCKARADVSREFLAQTIGSPDETIGARISDSYIERDVAACAQDPLMTVAVRDLQTGEPVRDFEQALEVVTRGIERLGGAGWAAIEGDAFYGLHSTVVRVSDVTKVELIREGDISLEEILAATDSISGVAVKNWG